VYPVTIMAESAKEFIGTIEAAKVLGVGSRQVVNMIREGMLPAQHVAGSYIIRRADLAKVPTNRPRGPKPAKPKKSKG
jgi:excisionase family DNA binding protein